MSRHQTADCEKHALPRSKKCIGTDSRPRLISRCVALAIMAIVVSGAAASCTAATAVVAVSPFLAAGAALATRAVSVATLFAVPVALLVVLRRRWFCRWLCPTGLLCEQTGAVARRVMNCVSSRQRNCVTDQADCLRKMDKEPASRSGLTRLPIGHWFAMVTFAGAVLGWPMLLWLDPLALLASFLGAGWSTPLAASTLLGAAGLAAVLALSAVMPGLWCTRICPLGATQELLYAACRQWPRADAVPAQSRAWVDREPRWRWPIARRAVLAGALGAVWAWAARRRLLASTGTIRPPGAIDELSFRGVCVRCGNCARVCPTKIIRADLGKSGLSGLMCPTVEFNDGYCREDCWNCAMVCPSGAIARPPHGEKRSAAMGLAVVDFELCLLTDNRECGICRNCCPYEAITTVWSEEEYTMMVKVDPDRCPGCGACQAACPTAPNKAIVVRSSQ